MLSVEFWLTFMEATQCRVIGKCIYFYASGEKWSFVQIWIPELNTVCQVVLKFTFYWFKLAHQFILMLQMALLMLKKYL